ncbi:unnamed protein product [Microthlaspi erraticum]|uniref:Uncharacterized protein n=1 Tax=Microthlaspi erraticum TaxID=1685480 RepID=A0A6D2J0H2_9BRAS|nr:unnamed protein product [Microthlaspi erraticum]
MLLKNLRSVVAQVNHGRRSISTRSLSNPPSSLFTPEYEKRITVFVTSVCKGIFGYSVWETIKLVEYGRTMERALHENRHHDELAAIWNALKHDLRELFHFIFSVN